MKSARQSDTRTETGTTLTIDHAHASPDQAIAEELGTDDLDGLSAVQVAGRLVGDGPNTLPEAHRQGPLVRFALQFHSPLIYVLLACAGATAALGDTVDSVVILAVVVVNAIVGFVQEARAEHALAALAALTGTTASVVRDGAVRRVPAAEIVPGDLVVLEAGDRVPAELRLIVTNELKIDESTLTGESVSSLKCSGVLPRETGLADRVNMAYSGTLVADGTGRGLAVATGATTELGAIHRLTGQARGVVTPLTRKIAGFSRVMTLVIVVLSALTFLIGLVRGRDAAETLTAAVALAVGAIPEGLPAIITITLALGVARMARRAAIVRRLPAVETLGSTTVICTDKTGTLTENQMTVTSIVAGDARYEVSGTGYEPGGQILHAGQPVRAEDHPALHATLLAGAACNDSQHFLQDGRWQISGDPTEAALLVSAGKAGLTGGIPARTGTVPFTSERQHMITHHADGTSFLKGSVERVLGLCSGRLSAEGAIEPLDQDTVTTAATALGDRALRVLALARSHDQHTWIFVGLQAMHDPPRATAAASVRACLDAGIQVKMITGDHAATARAIAAGIGIDGPVLTGTDLTATSDEALPQRADDTAVFARVSPEQKLRLVRALQARSHVVAMTGDGVNDAPALKQADIGIAMGRSGTEVAKESADIVLTDDDFATIRAAVEEGRSVLDNLIKFLVWALPANLALGLVLLAAIITGTDLPILPSQVLWLNMTAVLALGLPFATEPGDPTIMSRPPRPPAAPLLSPALTTRIALVSVLLTAAAFALFHWQLHQGHPLDQARTTVANLFAFALLTYVFNCLSLDHPVLWSGLRRNPPIAAGIAALLALQAVYTYAPPVQRLFHTAALPLPAWTPILATAAALYLAVELIKRIQTRSSQEGTTQ